jgi:hypothetical protein
MTQPSNTLNIRIMRSIWLLNRLNKTKGAPYHKKSFSSANPSLEDYSSFNRKMTQKMRTTAGYNMNQSSGNSKSRIDREK